MTDAKGNEESYTYDKVNRTKTVESGESKVEYTYEKDQLKQISMNDGEAKYHFDYDSLGRKTAVQTSRGDSEKHWLATYGYTGNTMTDQTYSNGLRVDFTYDELERLVEKKYGDYTAGPIRYSYDPNGNLYKVTDGLWSSGIQTLYEYDLAGRIVGVRAAETTGIQNHRASMERRYTDGKGTVESQSVRIYGPGNQTAESVKYTYRYGDWSVGEMPGVLYDVEKDGASFLEYVYDGLGRVTERKVGGLTAKEKYTYSPGPDGTTTTQVKTFRDLHGVVTTFQYDANGNITSANSARDKFSYTYDGLGRLVRANEGEPDVNYTETYTYDDRGNIVSRTKYTYYLGSLEGRTPTETITYKYEDERWADLLTEYDGQTLTYDSIGNPLSYRDGMTMTWKHGRSLQSITKGGETLGWYNYNGDGLRTYKSAAGYGSVEYHILDGQYVGQTQTINGKTYDTLYLYDDGGNIIGLQEDGEIYYFVRTLQGNVAGLLDAEGNKVAMYTYDTCGNVAGVYTGLWQEITDPEHIAVRNPFRYRGYMYDEESGLYYLQSRYYDPVTGRFVNADGFVSTGTGLMGYNMFAYCNNNPVMYVDATGARPASEIQADIDALEAFINETRYAIANQTTSLNAEDMLHYAQQLSALKQELADVSPFLNQDGTYSLYDNQRHDPDRLFHEQIAALKYSGPGFSLKDGNITLGSYEASVYTGGWEWDHADLSLFDFGRASFAAGITGGKLTVGATASVYNPSFSVDLFGMKITVSARIGAIGGEAKIGNGTFSVSSGNGIGFGLSITKIK